MVLISVCGDGVGPTALKAHNVATGKCVTCYPSFQDRLNGAYIVKKDDRVIVDGMLFF